MEKPAWVNTHHTDPKRRASDPVGSRRTSLQRDNEGRVVGGTGTVANERAALVLDGSPSSERWQDSESNRCHWLCYKGGIQFVVAGCVVTAILLFVLIGDPEYVNPPLPGYDKDAVTMTELPQDKGNESPAALDGSPYGIYFSPSSTNSTKWTFWIDGGGWCYDETDCYLRSFNNLGSSTVLQAEQPTRVCSCLNTNDTMDGWDEDCNCLIIPYLDGAGFAGDRAEPYPVPNTSASIYFRGKKNLQAAIEFAFQNGLESVTQLVVSGGSAGGLSTFVHVDKIAEVVRANAPNVTRIHAVPESGYFLDRPNFYGTTGYPGGPNSPQWTKVGLGTPSYSDWMKYIFQMQNMSFGDEIGSLDQECEERYPDTPWLCFMAPHIADMIKTPFFLISSKYDTWQLQNVLQIWPASSDRELEAVLQYGNAFLSDLQPALNSTRNGVVITSCVCHGCWWDRLLVEGKHAEEWYFLWLNGTTTGIESIHIDPESPNGGDNADSTFNLCDSL